MLLRKRMFTVGIFLLASSIVASLAQHNKTEKQIEEEDKSARIIENVNGRQSLREIIQKLFGNTASTNYSTVDEEEESEEASSNYYEASSGSGREENQENESVTDIEQISINSTEEKIPIALGFHTTVEGVDPNDPEEIARLAHYNARLKPFDRILASNNASFDKANFIKEGDIRINPLRNAGDGALWKKTRYGRNRGLVEIPYKISSRYNSSHIRVIRSAMAAYAKHTCIRFVPRRHQIGYLLVDDGAGCSAYVGNTGNSAQLVTLAIPNCVTKGVAIHELMHSIGFQHEHSRSDRDKYVRVIYDHIKGGVVGNFDKHDYTKNLVIYDYNSVMHYSREAFAIEPYLPTIQIYPKRKPEPDIGQRDRLSPYDIEEIKYLYNCGPGTYRRCGRDFFNATSGSFQSPNYPSPYADDTHCTWNITAAPGKFVEVTFKGIDIKDSPLCEEDGILVHNGIDAAAPVLRKICGSPSNDVKVTSTGQSIFIIFSTNHQSNQDHRAGFKATFKEVSIPGKVSSFASVPTLPPITNTVPEFHCNFDAGLCGMIQDDLDNLDYLRIQGETPSKGTGPFRDHTTGKGHYIFVESSLPSEAGDNAIIRTPWFNQEKQYCVTFSYHMLGLYMGGLRLYAFEKRRNDDNGHEMLLWKKDKNQGRRWKTKQFTYTPRKYVEKVQFYWETFVYFYQSDIALDDIHVIPGDCNSNRNKNPSQRIFPTTKAQSTASTTTPIKTTKTTTVATTTPPPIVVYSKLNCTFDQDLCGFTQATSDNFDWTRNRGGTPSASTGPSRDHTTGNGYYLYVEASAPRSPGQISRLVSPLLSSSVHCLRMSYHMYGKQTGKLSVYEVVNGLPAMLVEKVGDSGNHWLPLTVEVNSPNYKKSIIRRDPENKRDQRPLIEADEGDEAPEVVEDQNDPGSNPNETPSNTNALRKDHKEVQIIVEATIGSGYAGDIAIDDIIITDSTCDDRVTAAPDIPLLDKFACDFEAEKLCGFEQAPNDDFDWSFNRGETGSSGTGPPADHTKKTQNGVYVYTESSAPRRIRDVAELITPKLRPNNYCIQLAYHMHGSATGELSVLSLEERPGGVYTNPTTLWNEAGPQGDQWNIVSTEFLLSDQTKSVQFVFQGVLGTSFTSDMALDDIFITPGLCSPTTTSIMASTTQSITTRLTTSAITSKPTFTTTTTSKVTATTTLKTTTPKQTTTTTTPKPTTITTTMPSTTTLKSTATPKPTITLTTSKQTPTVPKATATTTPKPTTKITTSEQTTISTNAKVAKLNHPSTFSCDFESRVLCGMSQSSNDIFDWTRRRYRTPSKNTGPTSDNTKSAKRRGHYIYIEGSRPQAMHHFAVVSTPDLSITTPKRCVIFYYHMWGTDIGSLNVFADFTLPQKNKKSADKVQQVHRLIHQVNGNQGATWKLAEIEINQNNEFYQGSLQISFRAVRGKGFKSDIAIDDICISDGPCGNSNRCSKNGVLSPPPVATTGTSSSRSTTTAPAAQTTTTMQKPQLLTKLAMRLPKRVASTASIIVSTTKTTTAPPTTTTTTTSPPPTTTTTTTSPPPTTPLPPTTIQSSTVTTAASSSSPAWNGPKLWSGMPRCTFETNRRSGNPLTARHPTAPGNTTRDLGEYVYPDTMSNNPLCGWKQAKNDKFDWQSHRGATRSLGTGPSRDKTNGQGRYMYIEASSPRVPGDIAVLQTYLMQASPYCMHLNYHMWGAFIGRLNVKAVQTSTTGQISRPTIHTVSGSQGRSWKEVKINYKPKDNIAAVAFRLEGIVGNDYRGDIAVDDITIIPGSCDACKTITQVHVNELNQEQRFTTGCIDSGLFWVRCCSVTGQKAIYRRVTQCTPKMFSSSRLNWFCSYL